MHIIVSNNASGVGAMGLRQLPLLVSRAIPELAFQTVEEADFIPDKRGKMKNYDVCLAFQRDLASSVDASLAEGTFTLNIIGDHSAGIATVSAASQHAKNLGLVWIDAHTDINTPDTSMSGNIHGMPVAALLHLFHDPLGNILNKEQKINPRNIVYLGLRDVDPPEERILLEQGIRAYRYQDILEQGLEHILSEIAAYLGGCDRVHLSFDLDVLDPKDVPSVSVPVEQGLKPKEGVRILQTLLATLPVASVDLAEYNAALDQDEKGLRVLQMLITSVYNFRKEPVYVSESHLCSPGRRI